MTTSLNPYQRCTVYTGDVRCERDAVRLLHHPDGTPNPGGWVCDRHGREIVEEYREKLGEFWTARLIGDAP